MALPDPLPEAPPRIGPPAASASSRFSLVPSEGSGDGPALRGPLQRVKAGPIAAGVATALILALTAVPAAVPGMASPVKPTNRPLAVYNVRTIDHLPGLAPVELGPGLGGFEIEGSLHWTDRADGTAAIGVSLRSVDDPSATLEGKFLLRRPARTTEIARAMVVAYDDQSPGLDPMRLMPPTDEYDRSATAYLSLAGELVGGGALEGVRLDVRNAPGEVVRRGDWRHDSGDVIDTAFARLFWLRDSAGSSTGVQGDALPDDGSGTLALRLVGDVL